MLRRLLYDGVLALIGCFVGFGVVAVAVAIVLAVLVLHRLDPEAT